MGGKVTAVSRLTKKAATLVRLKGGDLFGFAGLWDCWKYPDGLARDHYSFTIITTEPNDLVGKAHNRMPVILRPEDEDRWLDPDLKDPEDLLPMLQPYPSEEMEGYPVTRAVNSPSHNGPDCIAPVSL